MSETFKIWRLIISNIVLDLSLKRLDQTNSLHRRFIIIRTLWINMDNNFIFHLNWYADIWNDIPLFRDLNGQYNILNIQIEMTSSHTKPHHGEEHQCNVVTNDTLWPLPPSFSHYAGNCHRHNLSNICRHRLTPVSETITE